MSASRFRSRAARSFKARSSFRTGEALGTLSGLVTSNTISGNAEITYEGSFDAINTPIPVPGFTTYTNNVSGWIESVMRAAVFFRS